jgi:hypothetical protein
MKDFTPHQEALELKQLGFDEAISTYYSFPDNELSYVMDGHNKVSVRRNSQFGHAVSAPTYQQVFRWFREKHGLYSWITMELGNKSTFCWVLSGEHTSTQYAAYFHTYEEAELACLIKLIELIKNK